MEGTNYPLSVDDVGEFEVRRTTGRLKLAIMGEYSRLLNGTETPTPRMSLTCENLAYVKVLVSKKPDGFSGDIDDPAVDIFDEAYIVKLDAVVSAIRDKERFFRGGGGPLRAPTSEGT